MQKKNTGDFDQAFLRGCKFIVLFSVLNLLVACAEIEAFFYDNDKQPLKIILDSDTNNELDDQHAMAYLLSNPERFNLQGITVNKTTFGGTIEDQVLEAERVLKICDSGDIGVFKGAEGGYKDIKREITEPGFDGSEAVNFIINKAKASMDDKLVILAVGKLTNVALALLKEPEVTENLRVVWLGSNYPHAREYNLINDVEAVNAVLKSNVEFEMVTVREGLSTGTANVVVYVEDIKQKLPGIGPVISTPVEGRNGKLFSNFGDYSISLFEIFPGGGVPPGRSFFDVAAVAILKKPYWAEQVSIAAPLLSEKGEWTEQPENKRKIIYWEDFEKNKIKRDFFDSMEAFAQKKIIVEKNKS